MATNASWLTSTEVPADFPWGEFQQFNLSLLSNGANSPGLARNACQNPLGAGLFNCVESNDETFHRLTVPGKAVKIPSSLIARGGSRSQRDRAASTSISTLTPAKAWWLEAVAGRRTFGLKPVVQAGGMYDVVAGSGTMPSMANASDATITTYISVTQANDGPNGLVIPLLPGSSPAVALEAQLTSQSSASATPATINFGAVQMVAPGVEAQIPLYNGTTSNPVTTTADCTGTAGPAYSGSPACPAGTDCACISLVAPEDNPVIGATGGPYVAPAASPALYSVFGAAGTCNPADQITGSEPAPLPTPTLSFVNCQ